MPLKQASLSEAARVFREMNGLPMEDQEKGPARDERIRLAFQAVATLERMLEASREGKPDG